MMQNTHLHTHKCSMSAGCAYRDTQQCPDNSTGCMLYGQNNISETLGGTEIQEKNENKINNKDAISGEEMRQQMELQLHEQYAQNNNAYLNSIIALFVGMLAAIGAYGYVFIHSVNYFEPVSGSDTNLEYSLTQLTYAMIVAIFVINIIMCICIIQGTAQRCEQFIIQRIRDKYYDENSKKEIFPDGYKPCDKKGLQIVQGLYGEFVKIGCITETMVLLSYCAKLIDNIISLKDGYNLNLNATIWVTISVLVCVAMGYIVLNCMRNSEQKYFNREKNIENPESSTSSIDERKPMSFLYYLKKIFILRFCYILGK